MNQRKSLVLCSAIALIGLCRPSIYLTADDQTFQQKLESAGQDYAERMRTENDEDTATQRYRRKATAISERSEQQSLSDEQAFRASKAARAANRSNTMATLKSHVDRELTAASDRLQKVEAKVAVEEAESRGRHAMETMEFKRGIEEATAKELADAVDRREKKKKAAIMVAGAMFGIPPALSGAAADVAESPNAAPGANPRPSSNESGQIVRGQLLAEQLTQFNNRDQHVPQMVSSASPPIDVSAVDRLSTPVGPIKSSERLTPPMSRGVQVYDKPIGPKQLPAEIIADMDGVQSDWLDPIGMILGAGLSRLGGLRQLWSPKTAPTIPKPSSHGVSTFVPKRIDSATVLQRSKLDPGPNHNFPCQLDEFITGGTPKSVSPSYKRYSQPGTLNGKSGVYEIGVKPSPSGKTETVTHRLFRPAKKNQNGHTQTKE